MIQMPSHLPSKSKTSAIDDNTFPLHLETASKSFLTHAFKQPSVSSKHICYPWSITANSWLSLQIFSLKSPITSPTMSLSQETPYALNCHPNLNSPHQEMWKRLIYLFYCPALHPLSYQITFQASEFSHKSFPQKYKPDSTPLLQEYLFLPFFQQAFTESSLWVKTDSTHSYNTRMNITDQKKKKKKPALVEIALEGEEERIYL